MSTLTLETPINTTPFDKVWISQLSVFASPQGKTSVTAFLKPYNGVAILDRTITLRIEDVFDLAAKVTTFAKVVSSLMEEVGRQAKLAKLI